MNMFLLLTFACTPQPECPEGQLRSAEGICVTPQHKTYDSIYTEDLPDCEYAESSSRLDLVDGCVDGACPDMYFQEVNDALGEEGTCTNPYMLGSTRCEWGDGGIHAYFDDDDNDGVPDSDATNYGYYLEAPYSGSNEDGLALGISMACFMEALKYTDEFETVEVDGKLYVVELYYTNWGLFVHDSTSDPDGIADRMSLYGNHYY